MAGGPQSLSLAGQVALVVGASRGIGASVALALAGAGADVAVTGCSTTPEPVAEEIRAMGRRALSLVLDVTNTSELPELVATVHERLGRLDILVHSAGRAITGPALDITAEEWDHVLDLNLRAAFFTAQAAARVMREQGGRIIFLASVMGLVAESGIASYAASKGGLVHLTRALALEWARWGITVNAIAPGYVETALNADLFANPRFRQRAIDRTPLRRLARPDDMGGAAVLLASPAGGFITGQTLVVDGGWTIQ